MDSLWFLLIVPGAPNTLASSAGIRSFEIDSCPVITKENFRHSRDTNLAHGSVGARSGADIVVLQIIIHCLLDSHTLLLL